MRGGVEPAHDVEQIAVGLEVHADLAGAAMGERHAERGRQAVAEPGPAASAVGPLGPPVPEPARPALGGAVGEHPVFVLDHLPDLGGERRRRQRGERALELRRRLPLREQARVPRGDALGALAALGRARVARQTVLDRGQQRGQRDPRVGGDRQVDRRQRLERVRPAADRVVVQRDRDHARRLVEQAHRARGAVRLAERAEDVGDVQREDDVGLGHDLLARAAHVERMAARHAGAALGLAGEIHQRRRQALGQAAERGRRLGTAAERLDDDQREARLDEPPRRLVDGARIGVRRRRGLKPRDVRHRHGMLQRFLL